MEARSASCEATAKENACRGTGAQESSEWEHLYRRLDRLERHDRILKWFVAIAGVAVVGAGILPDHGAVNKTVEANSCFQSGCKALGKKQQGAQVRSIQPKLRSGMSCRL